MCSLNNLGIFLHHPFLPLSSGNLLQKLLMCIQMDSFEPRAYFSCPAFCMGVNGTKSQKVGSGRDTKRFKEFASSASTWSRYLVFTFKEIITMACQGLASCVFTWYYLVVLLDCMSLLMQATTELKGENSSMMVTDYIVKFRVPPNPCMQIWAVMVLCLSFSMDTPSRALPDQTWPPPSAMHLLTSGLVKPSLTHTSSVAISKLGWFCYTARKMCRQMSSGK